ncbi:MAG: SDR family oxidoreductase [Candidatus Omnitrophota bacterium]
MNEYGHFPEQNQEKPGKEYKMEPLPLIKGEWYKGSGKLSGKIALVTGGDSGIGSAVSIFFAREGASVSIVYYNEHKDAQNTQRMIEEEGQKCLLIPGNVGDPEFCAEAVEKTLAEFGHVDILVNNAGYQNPHKNMENITDQDIETTFRTNIFSYFYMTRAALKHMREGAAIINTASVTAYEGHPTLLDYAATKGAIVAFTRSLSLSLIKQGIRVNGVAPGPIWTPLIISGFSPEKVKTFGQKSPMGRAGHPEEVAASYVFLASRDSSYMSGQMLHPNGGTIVNG